MTPPTAVTVDAVLDRLDMESHPLEIAPAPPQRDQRFVKRLHDEAPGQWVRFPHPTPLARTLVMALARRFRTLGAATEVTRRGRGWDLWLKAE